VSGVAGHLLDLMNEEVPQTDRPIVEPAMPRRRRLDGCGVRVGLLDRAQVSQPG
jgi:hypothetical protein